MIDKAFVSGQIGQSVFAEQEKLFIVKARDTEDVLECTPYEHNLFFDSGAEIKIFENITIEELREKLIKEKRRFDALYGVIGGFDPNLSDETRVLSIQQAENLIKDTETLAFVKSRLFGNPAPKKTTLKKALKLARANSANETGSLYHALLNNRNAVDYILAIFKDSVFELSLEKEFIKIKNMFITNGLFAKLFSLITDKNTKNLEDICEIGFCIEIKEKIPMALQILTLMKDSLEKKYISDGNWKILLDKSRARRTKSRVWPQIISPPKARWVIQAPAIPYGTKEEEKKKDIEAKEKNNSDKTKKKGTKKKRQ